MLSVDLAPLLQPGPQQSVQPVRAQPLAERFCVSASQETKRGRLGGGARLEVAESRNLPPLLIPFIPLPLLSMAQLGLTCQPALQIFRHSDLLPTRDAPAAERGLRVEAAPQPV